MKIGIFGFFFLSMAGIGSRQINVSACADGHNNVCMRRDKDDLDTNGVSLNRTNHNNMYFARQLVFYAFLPMVAHGTQWSRQYFMR